MHYRDPLWTRTDIGVPWALSPDRELEFVVREEPLPGVVDVWVVVWWINKWQPNKNETKLEHNQIKHNQIKHNRIKHNQIKHYQIKIQPNKNTTN